MAITLIPVHRYACFRHQTWTRTTHGLALTKLPEVIRARRRLDRLDRRHIHIAAGSASEGIPAVGRRRPAAFPETVVPAELVLDPPAHSVTPKDLYLATTAELSRRLSRIYTSLGTQDPLLQHLCDPQTDRRGSRHTGQDTPS